MKPLSCIKKVTGVAVTAIFLAAGTMRSSAQAGVAAACLQVTQNDTNNTDDSVSVTTTLSVNDFRVRGGSNRGDYNVQIGSDFAGNVASGVLISCVAENGRDNGEATYPGSNYCSSTIDYSRTDDGIGGYFVSTFQSPSGAEYNVNVAAAFFPYTNWLGGLARNSGATNGGPDDLFTGSRSLVPGTNFVEYGGGRFSVNLTNLGIDARTDGVLLVCGGKNEDNYALSQANGTNGAWNVFLKDNGVSGTACEQDPVAFVFVPKTNTSVVSGKFRGDGARLIYSGVTPAFQVTNCSAGCWRLTIPGQSPASGVLIVSGEGGGAHNADNLVSYQPDGDGWLIESRDVGANPPVLESVDATEPVASFVFIPSLAPALLAPANAATAGASPTLKVAAPNGLAGNLTVTFYGRLAGVPNTNRDFSIVAVPDSQFYSASMNGGLPAMFEAQTDWMVAQRTNLNLAFVTHLGDISENGQNGGNTAQWLVATNAMYRLENTNRTQLAEGIPYGMCVGNHDQTPIGTGAAGNTTFFNQFFGFNHFDRFHYYGGHYGANGNNSYQLFSAGGMDFIIIHMEYNTNPVPAVLEWANNLLKAYPNRRAIVASHWIVNTGFNATFSAQGRAIYDTLRTNANLFLMLCGHVSGEGQRADVFQGNTVYSILTDYQSRTNGGDGWLRYYTFSPSNNVIRAFTRSPWLGQDELDADSRFELPYAMNLAATNGSFSALATNTVTRSNNLASCVWRGLPSGKAFEWYAVVSDQAGNVATSPVWRFQTRNTDPAVTNQACTVPGDASARLMLPAFDAEGDALTWQINTPPSSGLLLAFDADAGTVTYLPAHGFGGTDRFTYGVSDGLAASKVATVTLTVVPPVSTNGKGLPDAWAAVYGITDPDGDADGDGESNLAEYLANTDPTNAASVLRITSQSLDSQGCMVLVWPSVGGTRYRVQYLDGRTGGLEGTFLDIVRPVTSEMDAAPLGTASTQSFVDDGSLTGGRPEPGTRFYRIKVVQ